MGMTIARWSLLILVCMIVVRVTISLLVNEGRVPIAGFTLGTLVGAGLLTCIHARDGWEYGRGFIIMLSTLGAFDFLLRICS